MDVVVAVMVVVLLTSVLDWEPPSSADPVFDGGGGATAAGERGWRGPTPPSSRARAEESVTTTTPTSTPFRYERDPPCVHADPHKVAWRVLGPSRADTKKTYTAFGIATAHEYGVKNRCCVVCFF